MSMSTEDSSADGVRSRQRLTPLENAAMRQLAAGVLTRRAGPDADAAALAAAVRRASGELTRVLAPVMGRLGIDALAGRAVHLVQREYPWLAAARDSEQAEELFSQLSLSLAQQDSAVAAEAAAAVLATFTGLVARLIGEPLAMRLMRQAWPDAVSDAGTEETRA
jgi:hypothetical protein